MQNRIVESKSEQCPACGGTARLSTAYMCQCLRRMKPWLKALIAILAVGACVLGWAVYELREAAEWRDHERIKEMLDDQDRNREVRDSHEDGR